MWAVTKAPLIIGCDITDMDADTLEILSNKEVIAINQDPLGLPVLRRGDPLYECGAAMHVFAGPLANGDVVVALFMPVPANFCHPRPPLGAMVKWEMIGFPATAQLAVRDLWAHEDLGVYTGEFLVTGTAAYKTHVLRLSPTDGSKHSLMKDYKLPKDNSLSIS